MFSPLEWGEAEFVDLHDVFTTKTNFYYGIFCRMDSDSYLIGPLKTDPFVQFVAADASYAFLVVYRYVYMYTCIYAYIRICIYV